MELRKKPSTAQWLQAAMTHAKITSQAEMARQIEEHLHAGFDRSKVQKMAAGLREMSALEMLAIEEITGFPAPVASRSDFALVPFIDWDKMADLPHEIPVENVPRLAFSDLGEGDFVATRVPDDSMDRISPEGSTIIVDRNDQSLVSEKCYIVAVDGIALFRMYWAPESVRLLPCSQNLKHIPTFAAENRRWSVIGRVRRSILDFT
jgi:hypothetical protein